MATARGPQAMETPNSGQRRNVTQNSHLSHPQDAQHPRGVTVQNGVTCNRCGATCALRTANTANNRGRKFYTCQAPECNFFVWEDETGNDVARGRTGAGSRGNSSRSRSFSGGRRGGRSQGQRRENTADATFVTATGEPVSGRCYACGDPSHFANVCPNRGN